MYSVLLRFTTMAIKLLPVEVLAAQKIVWLV
nr:MAG TPA: UreF [Caudoviricetes sp.]